VCPRDISQVKMTTLKKPKATKCSNHHTSSLITHTEEIVARIFRSRIERKIQDELEEDQCGFKR